MMKKIPLLIVCLLLFFGSCSSLFDRDLKQARENEKMFNYSLAKENYLNSYERNESESSIRGLAYTNIKLREFGQAESWFSRLERNGNLDGEDYYYYALVLQANAKFQEAMQYLAKLQSDTVANVPPEKIQNLETSLNLGKSMLNKGSNIVIETISGINTEFSEFGAEPNGEELIFISDRLQKEGGVINSKNAFKSERDGWTGNSFFSVYTSKLDYEKNAVEDVEKHEFYEHDYHIGPVSGKGKYRFFAKTDKTSEAKNLSLRRDALTVNPGLYYSEKVSDEWSDHIPFEFNSTLEYMVIDPFWDEESQTLYFSSDMPAGYGGLDLYQIRLENDSTWSQPQSLGPELNTSGDDRSPFLDSNGDFYFSSEGHPGLGGLDVFVMRNFKSGNRTIENLGAPINSNRDDFFFFKVNDDFAFFSSDRQGGMGSDDVYRINLNLEEFVLLKGKVLDRDTDEPIANAVITAVNKSSGVSARYVADNDGEFQFKVPVLNAYSLSATATDYIRESLEDALIGNEEERTKGEKFVQIYLEKMELDKTYTVENIFYDFDKAVIRDDAKPELNKLANLLQENPTLKIELHSYTDSRGTEKYNQRLSEKRAQSAVDFIVSLGISSSRISAKGFGESQLVNNCKDGVKCSEEEHQENRRTEFKIIDY